jgi:Co/Zn/Cd efflux system component
MSVYQAGLLVAGVLASSSALLANALDNASDVVVYALSLFEATRGVCWKVRAASVSGVVLLIVAVGVTVDVMRRLVEGAEPVGLAIMAMAVVAAVVNILCLRILSGHRTEDVTLRATWTFSVNDLLSNLGVLFAGGLVLWLGQAWPDLVIGLVIAVVVAKGGIEILLDARRTSREQRV